MRIPTLTAATAPPLVPSATQQLEQRGLLLKNPAMIAAKGAGQHAISNLIHLTRFAPPIKLGPQQMFKVRPVPRDVSAKRISRWHENPGREGLGASGARVFMPVGRAASL